MGAVVIVIKWIIVIIDKIPSDQIVTIPIAIFIAAILPARIIQKIARINATIAVVIENIGGIGGAVEVTESDQAI